MGAEPNRLFGLDTAWTQAHSFVVASLWRIKAVGFRRHARPRGAHCRGVLCLPLPAVPMHQTLHVWRAAQAVRAPLRTQVLQALAREQMRRAVRVQVL